MRQYTPQTAFNKIWRHFVRDKNPRAVDSAGVCLYRTDTGRRCAVGIFIPESEYSPDFESKRVTNLFHRLPFRDLFPSKKVKEFMETAQGVHDGDWGGGHHRMIDVKHLRLLADEFNLTVPTC